MEPVVLLLVPMVLYWYQWFYMEPMALYGTNDSIWNQWFFLGTTGSLKEPLVHFRNHCQNFKERIRKLLLINEKSYIMYSLLLGWRYHIY